jgi:hypothetical protein
VSPTSRSARFPSLAILAALLLLAAGSPARAAAGISGQILGPAGVTPMPQAQVTFYNLVTGTTYRSDPAGPDGGYKIDGLAAGRYDVAVETTRGLWLVDRAITLRDGEVRTFSFALRERAYWEGADTAPARTSPLGVNIVGTAVILEAEQKGSATPGSKRKLAIIATAGGAGVLALVLLGGDSNAPPQASPFVP